MQEKSMQQLRVLLKAVLLRRTKKSEINGKPILNLPPRVTEQVHAIFSTDEDDFYKALETRSALQVNRYLEAGSAGRHYSNILVLLLRLRQACCHPHLIKDFAIDLNAATGDIDLVANAKQFTAEVVNRLKENEPLECPVCIDAVENPIIFFPCGHGTCTECFARISDPSLGVQQGHDGVVEVKCPNCRAKVDTKKITDHHTFKKVHFSLEGNFEEDSGPAVPATSEAMGENEDADDSDEGDDSDDSDERGSLSDFIIDDGDDTTELSKKKKKQSRKSKGKEPKKPDKTLAVLKKEASRNAKAKRKYLRRLQETWVSSAKIDKTMELLHQLRDEGKGEKTIIFSQFTSLLDLLEIPINREGWHYRRYDGSMRPGDRNDAVVEFTDNPQCTVLLVSLKAGNAGLNLVAASRVVIFDPFWNPYVEEQAIDRAHRIGQMRPVHIHRILVQGTVEDRILELQEKKRALIEGALDENAAKSVARLSTRELKYLFVSSLTLLCFMLSPLLTISPMIQNIK
jgi:SNF2 family DNA or RNA helicase